VAQRAQAAQEFDKFAPPGGDFFGAPALTFGPQIDIAPGSLAETKAAWFCRWRCQA
jgi:hypothetical protein